MLTVDEALARLLAQAQPITDADSVPTVAAHGRVLAQPVVSAVDVPPMDNSQMDGCAVRCADVPAPATLRVTQRIAAGHPGQPLELDKVPLKYEGLDQWEIWVSESQERMTIAVRPEHLKRFMELSVRHGVESTVIGEYDSSGHLRLDYKGKTCALIRMDFLESDFPQWQFEAEWLPPELRGLAEPVLSEPKEHGLLLRDILSRPNIAAKNSIARQYDHEVQGGCVIKPLVGKRRDMVSDAVVMRPLLGSSRGIAITQALNPFYSPPPPLYPRA